MPGAAHYLWSSFMNNGPTSAVAIVAIVILVLAALGGGYMFMGRGPAADKNDIHIDLPGGKK